MLFCGFPIEITHRDPEQEDTQDQPLQVPLMAFAVRMPADGLPVLTDWHNTAASIWSTGFEGWREPCEIKAMQECQLGKPMSFGSVEAAKGQGRLSALYFGILYTYLKLKDMLSEEETADFTRPPALFGGSRFQLVFFGLASEQWLFQNKPIVLGEDKSSHSQA